MPPGSAPPTLPQPIQHQMDALRKQYHALDALINRLKSLSGATLTVQQELARHAREESKAIESKIEDLRILADEQDKESDRALTLTMLGKIEDQFKQQQRALRQAILSSKQAIDREAKSERELLLKGSKSAIELSEIRRRGNTKGNSSEYMLNTSKEHNESLGRTLKLMQQEVERTAHSATVIDESSKTLRETVGQYQTYDEVLKRGKNLITKLNQADWTDRLLIGFGLLVFSLVVMYILKKRIADRGISLVGYLFMPLRWLLSLLIPSLRSAPGPLIPSEKITEKLVETAPLLTEVVSNQVKGSLADEMVAAATSVAPTTAAQGFLGFLDAVVGE
ncbi:protein transport protein SEC20 [Entomortierella parvispora]|uniref:Protein transport protein SEC20 n=1 Tax=Entomortierella parvispora TaxID=205924 RepID=A0A9P3LX72_9FUNG|nr:protein transport protein SEC20 [Entomortierella parvispora]